MDWARRGEAGTLRYMCRRCIAADVLGFTCRVRGSADKNNHMKGSLDKLLVAMVLLVLLGMLFAFRGDHDASVFLQGVITTVLGGLLGLVRSVDTRTINSVGPGEKSRRDQLRSDEVN